MGNRKHLEFKRQVALKQAELYAQRNKMVSFEISPLCDFNIRESFCELARMALHRNGMERIWRTNKGNKCTHFIEENLFHIVSSPFPQTLSAHTARAVLSHDRPSHQRLQNRYTSPAAVCQVKSEILRTHLIARLQYARPHQKGGSLQDPNAEQRRTHTVFRLNVVHRMWRRQLGHAHQLHHFVILYLN